jgi:hypothetical protein
MWLRQISPLALIHLLALVLLLGASCGSSDDDDGQLPPPVTPSIANVLRLADAEGEAGTTATLVVSLENTLVLTGFQFDVSFDPDVLTVSAAAADSGRAAGLEAYWNAEGGTARILFTDIQNSGSIAAGDGPVATVTVEVNAAAPAGTIGLLVDSATGVDGDATTLTLGGSQAIFTVR